MTELIRATIQTIVIIDTHPISSKGLSTLLKKEFPRATITEAKTVSQFLETGPDLVSGLFILVVNSDFEEEGHNSVSELIKLYPQAHIILYGEELKAEVTIDFLKSGVKGYLLNQKDLKELVSCIVTVAEGDRYLSTDHMKYLFNYLIENYKTSKKQDLLTPRQKEISKLLVLGLTTSGIAERTGLHISTISTFKAAIFAKLGIDNILKLKQILEGEDDSRPK